MRRLLTLLITLTLAGAAHAQAVPQTSGLAVQREEVVELDGRRISLAGKRIHFESELDGLSAQIARLKSKRGSLLGTGTLDGKLVRSRELSAKIDQLRTLEAEVSQQLQTKARALLAAYDARILELRTSLENAATTDRERFIDRLASLETERQLVRSGLERLRPDAHIEGAGRVRPAERQDPESLRAEADRLRDTRDRLIRRIRSLQRRADELRAQAELDAEMRDFHAETSLFDEADYSVVQVSSSSNRSGGAMEVSSTAENASRNDADFAAGAAGGGDPGTGTGGELTAPPADARSSEPTSAFAAGYDDARSFFQLTRSASRAETLDAATTLLRHDGLDGSAETLEAREAEMKKLADRLKARAERLESEARTLDR